jgi:hypothetical protein
MLLLYDVNKERFGGANMRKFLKKCSKVLGVLILILIINYCINGLTYMMKETEDKLTLEELQDIKEAKRLKDTYGDKLFNGFSEVSIPIIAFNSSYEFRIASTSGDYSFNVLEENNQIVQDNIYVRESKNPQAFTAKFTDGWAASMSTYYTFNHEVLGYMRRDVPFGLWLLIPPQISTIKRDLIPCTIIHEAIHAYFGNLNEEKLNRAEALHKALKRYPYGNTIFREEWNKEGRALYNAMNAGTTEETIKYVTEFLDVRDKRRAESSLSVEMIDAVRLIEWEEGLAKYSEIRIYDFAAEDPNAPAYYKYKKGRPYSQGDFRSLKNNLGSRSEDYRFYLSGMAQAMILDKLSNQWKEDLYRNEVYLEDKLREVVKTDGF